MHGPYYEYTEILGDLPLTWIKTRTRGMATLGAFHPVGQVYSKSTPEHTVLDDETSFHMSIFVLEAAHLRCTICSSGLFCAPVSYSLFTVRLHLASYGDTYALANDTHISSCVSLWHTHQDGCGKVTIGNFSRDLESWAFGESAAYGNLYFCGGLPIGSGIAASLGASADT